MKLYEYDEELQAILEQAEEDGEIDDELFAYVEELMAKRTETRDHWLESLAFAFFNVNAEAEAIKVEKLRLQKRQSAAETKAERLKSYIASIAEREGVQKLTTERGVRFFWRKSTATQVNDDAKLPKRFLIPQDPKIDRTALAAALKAGQQIEGARLIERINLQIK